MRCTRECCADAVYPLPEGLSRISRGDDLSASTWSMLICPQCKSMTRPHVLLWDEYYDEPHYRFESSLDAAGKTALLIVAGTTGSANLPNQVDESGRKHRTATRRSHHRHQSRFQYIFRGGATKPRRPLPARRQRSLSAHACRFNNRPDRCRILELAF